MAVSNKQLKEMGVINDSPSSAFDTKILKKSLKWVKDDRKDDKLMWELLPFDALREVVKRFTFGAKKYGADNYKKCTDPERYWGALLRHIDAARSGERMDDNGLTHLSAVAWNALILVWLDLQEELQE